MHQKSNHAYPPSISGAEANSGSVEQRQRFASGFMVMNLGEFHGDLMATSWEFIWSIYIIPMKVITKYYSYY